MNGTGKENGKQRAVVGVFLACVSCGKVEEIHVFPEKKLSNRVYWECLDCQKHDDRGAGAPHPLDRGGPAM